MLFLDQILNLVPIFKAQLLTKLGKSENSLMDEVSEEKSEGEKEGSVVEKIWICMKNWRSIKPKWKMWTIHVS